MDTHLPSRLLRLVVASSLLAGCADVTSLMVEVTSSDLEVPADVDELRFEVRSASGRSVDRRFTIDAAWPHSLAVLPASSSDGAVVLTVSGLKGGTPVVRRVIETAFVSGLQRRVEVRLERACLGVQCGDGVDCVAGVCGGGVSDGGVDAGTEIMDGGPDAGPSDAGDASSEDDGGTDRDGGMDAGGDPDAGGELDGGRTPPQLLFSEYVEGTSNNKALEIQNLASASFDLTRCTLQRYSNGSTAAFPIPLTGSVGAGGFHVICHSSIAITTGCDQLTASLNHNGDDALVLVCDGATIDSFGEIGLDPAANWTGGGLSSEDYVLTRRCGAGPDTNADDVFDLSSGWQGVAWPTSGDPAVLLAGLGTRAPCP